MDNSSRPAFGQLLRRFRFRAGLSQETLAELARISAETVSALERGARRAPYRETVALLADALGLEPEDRTQLVSAAIRPQQPRRLRVVAPSTAGALSLDEKPDLAASLALVADAPRHNLPAEQSSLIGRDEVVAEVCDLLREHGLVSLVGTGGIGKTRVALRAAHQLVARWPDGVWLIELAPIADPALVVGATAQAVGCRSASHLPPLDALIGYLKQRQVLIILDNCEHVVDAVSLLVVDLRRSCPGVTILATSREPLNVPGEIVYRVPSLSYADSNRPPANADEGVAFTAVALFAERAHAGCHNFALNDENVGTVAEICRQLDGIPLAIELAAARVNVVSVSTLVRHLDERFRLLTGGNRTAPHRQMTLRALIDWSYDLLTSAEQTFFNRMGIFAGGFGLRAAAAMCAGEEIDEIDVLDLLSSLIDKSLIVADTSGEQERYRLLESTRAFALAKLTATGERERLARRHAEFFRDESEAADRRYGNGSTAAWLARVEIELDNYRAALEWALTNGRDTTLGSTMAGSLGWLWYLRGLTAEGRYWIGRAQASLDEFSQPRVAARLWRALAVLSSGKASLDCAERAVAISQTAPNDGHGANWALLELGLFLILMGRVGEAGETNARALAAMRDSEDKPGLARSLRTAADIAWRRGEVAEARKLFAQALDCFRGLKDEYGTALTLGSLAELEFANGRADQALRLVRETVEILALGDYATNRGIYHSNNAAYCIALGDLDGATKAAREGLRWAHQSQHAFGVAFALQHFAALAALRQQASDAARLIGYVNARYEEYGSEREATEQWEYGRLMAALREQLPEREIEKLVAEGRILTQDRAVEEALRLVE